MYLNILLIFVIFIIFVFIFASIFLLTSKQDTSNIQTGNFNSFIGNEIIREDVNLTEYIIQAKQKVSFIITEDIDIPLIIRKYPLGNGILATASMKDPDNIRGGGIIIINTVKLEDPTRWVNIIVHEILHVLGVGSCDKWHESIIDVNGELFLDRTLFPKSGEKYDFLINTGRIFGEIGDHIPLSDPSDSVNDGGSHLDERIFNREVMTPIADKVNVISSLSIALLEDIGFEVDYGFNEDEFL